MGDVTHPDAEQVLAGLDNVTLICAVLFLFYIFIFLYIWLNERNKRKTMTHRFQQGLDKDERANYLREKNRQRRERLERMQQGQNGQYRGMEMHVQQNNQLNGAQFLSEGM